MKDRQAISEFARIDARDSDDARELRLGAIRREAQEKGIYGQPGVRPSCSPIPVASPQEDYYQQPLLKEPQWTPLVPLYFFVGGASGSLGVVGSLADLLAAESEIARKARWMALGGASLSGVLLIADLGRPSRFLYMLRVFKPQSAMSMGSWILSGFSASTGLSSVADILESQLGRGSGISLLRGVGRTGSVLFGMPFHNYTGVLIAASVIPVWNNGIRSLPREFGMTGLQSAVSLLELTGHFPTPELSRYLSAAAHAWPCTWPRRRRSASYPESVHLPDRVKCQNLPIREFHSDQGRINHRSKL